MLIGGARILGQHPQQGGPARLLHRLQQLRGTLHPEAGLLGLAGKAPRRLGAAVRVGEIGLHIIDGSAVHQVGPRYPERRPPLGMLLDPLQPDAGQANGVGAEGRTGGKHPHAGIPPKARGAHRRGPVFPHRLGELPDEPEVRKALQSPQGVRVTVLRLKDHRGAQLLHQAALPRDAEFCGKIAVDPGDHPERVLFRHQASLLWGAAPYPLKRFIARSGPSFRRHSTASAARFTAPSMAFLSSPWNLPSTQSAMS